MVIASANRPMAFVRMRQLKEGLDEGACEGEHGFAGVNLVKKYGDFFLFPTLQAALCVRSKGTGFNFCGQCSAQALGGSSCTEVNAGCFKKQPCLYFKAFFGCNLAIISSNIRGHTLMALLDYKTTVSRMTLADSISVTVT